MLRIAWNRVGVVVCLHGWHRVPKRGRCISIATVLLSLVALPAAAQTAISADGEVESTSGGFKFPDGTIQTTTAADTDPPHLVGEAGEPAFGNGGQGDCLWMNATVLLPGLGPVSFYKDSDGIVRLAGVARAVDGGGGDGICGVPPPPPAAAPEGGADLSDNVIFVLPSGYQPEHLQIFPGIDPVSGGLLVVQEGGAIISGFAFPAGAVLVSSVTDETATGMDGITFRAAPGTTTSSLSREPANIPLEALRGLLFR